MDFLPSLQIFLAFTAASFVLIFTPGPDMTLFLGQTLTGGRARGFAAMFGAFTGVVRGMRMYGPLFDDSSLEAAEAAAWDLVRAPTPPSPEDRPCAATFLPPR